MGFYDDRLDNHRLVCGTGEHELRASATVSLGLCRMYEIVSYKQVLTHTNRYPVCSKLYCLKDKHLI